MKKVLLIFTMILSFGIIATSCSGGDNSKSSAQQESAEVAEENGIDIKSLEQQGATFRKIDEKDKGHIFYVRFNPGMLFFMESQLLGKVSNSGVESDYYAVQTLAEYDENTHKSKTGKIVFDQNVVNLEEAKSRFCDKSIKFTMDGDKLVVKGIDEEFDGIYEIPEEEQ